MEKKTNWKVLLLNIDVVIASAAMVALVALTFAGVIARYVVGAPFGWTEEVQQALIVWVIFGAAGAAFRTANHAAIEIFYEMFPPIVQKILNIGILIVTLITLGYLGKTSISYIQVFAATGRTTAVLHLSYIMIYGIAPVSCIWQIFNFILVNFFHYTEKETIEAITDEEFEEAKEKS
ncbi:MAG: TRAP transporter small permease [Lachnospiraceae bacterium]|nr:TRAP transporter small permease [Lachnospiraceae bacterium]